MFKKSLLALPIRAAINTMGDESKPPIKDKDKDTNDDPNNGGN